MEEKSEYAAIIAFQVILLYILDSDNFSDVDFSAEKIIFESK